MLYYSGMIRNMGEVHDGNTVTDYMDQERDRGIRQNKTLKLLELLVVYDEVLQNGFK